MVVNLIIGTSCFDAVITFCRAERNGEGEGLWESEGGEDWRESHGEGGSKKHG